MMVKHLYIFIYSKLTHTLHTSQNRGRNRPAMAGETAAEGPCPCGSGSSPGAGTAGGQDGKGGGMVYNEGNGIQQGDGR